MVRFCWLLGFAFLLGRADFACADEIEKHLQTIAQVGPQGAGSLEASKAAAALSKKADLALLPRLFQAMDTPNVVAANWVRTVYEDLAKRQLAENKEQLPVDFLREYIRDPKRQGRARRLALDLLDKVDSDFYGQLLPTLLDDPEFRSEAVSLAIKNGDKSKQAGEPEAAKAQYQKAFRSARDSSQIIQAAARLKTVGVEGDIVSQMGFLTRWYLLGPFEAPETSGFGMSFPPEKKVDLAAHYSGKEGSEISWKLYETKDQLALVNLNQAVAPVKEAVGYAYAEVSSPKDQQVQLRCGADDNLTVWVNGEKIFSRLQWLNGTRLDRFTAPAKLKKGKNQVLVKICQGPQHKNPAVPNNWSLQLRFCDESGGEVGLRSLLPEVEGK